MSRHAWGGVVAGAAVCLIIGALPTHLLFVRLAMLVAAVPLSVIGIRLLRADPNNPNVTLEMPTSGTFRLHNSGGAANVSISSITVPNRYEVKFPDVRDLHQETSIVPLVSPIGWTEAMAMGDGPMTFNDFLQRMARDKAIDIQEVRTDGMHVDSQTTSDLVNSVVKLRYPLVVTYKRQRGLGVWKRRETVLYDAASDTAWIEHGG